MDNARLLPILQFYVGRPYDKGKGNHFLALLRCYAQPSIHCLASQVYELMPWISVGWWAGSIGEFQSARFPWWRHQMETLPRYWPFVRGIHLSPVNSPHALLFSLICVWINGWVNNREAGDFKRYRAHYDVTVMRLCFCVGHLITSGHLRRKGESGHWWMLLIIVLTPEVGRSKYPHSHWWCIAITQTARIAHLCSTKIYLTKKGKAM